MEVTWNVVAIEQSQCNSERSSERWLVHCIRHPTLTRSGGGGLHRIRLGRTGVTAHGGLMRRDRRWSMPVFNRRFVYMLPPLRCNADDCVKSVHEFKLAKATVRQSAA